MKLLERDMVKAFTPGVRHEDGTCRTVGRRARAVPSVVEFDVCGRHFVADVFADGASYSAAVRGHDDCCTCGDTEAEIRRNLVEVVELAVFGVADRVYA